METLKIVKIGGNIIDDESTLDAFLKVFSAINGFKILIHGGGKSATKLANAMGVEVKMTNGRRITDADTLDIIIMVYAGKINKNIVAKLQYNTIDAVGFSGADGNVIVSEKRPVKEIDYGFVGDVTNINIKTPKLLLENGITPVFCAISHDQKGQLLNTNADTIAAEIAIAFSKDFNTELYYCFEKKGVLKDVNNDDSVIESINTNTYKELLANGVISDGMLPKLNNCFYALENKVSKVCIGQPTMFTKVNENFTTITI